MTLKIERYSEGFPARRFDSLGECRPEHLAGIGKTAKLGRSGSEIVIDLEQVDLVDVQVVSLPRRFVKHKGSRS